jgi:hypothetical protein
MRSTEQNHKYFNRGKKGALSDIPLQNLKQKTKHPFLGLAERLKW